MQEEKSVLSDQVANSEPNKHNTTGIRPYGFQKGVSGNPSGRPKKQIDLVKLAKTHTREAVETLVECLHAPRHADRITAAVALLDRGWGRPSQMILGDPNRPVAIDFRWADETPVANAARELVLTAIDVPPTPDATDNAQVIDSASESDTGNNSVSDPTPDAER